MITYLYWATAAFIALSLLIFFVKNGAIKIGLGLFVFVIFSSWAAYYFHFEQIFVKRFGGVMNIEMEENEIHLGSTWKDDNLWIESYDPETRTCHFREFSKGNLLQGRVNIKNCKPLAHSNIFIDDSKQGNAEPVQLNLKTQKSKADEAPVQRSPAVETRAEQQQDVLDEQQPITLDDMPVQQ
ncbi:MAG: hypothetical protein HRU20_31490 [Pseudomonadales bacterium]|nr:hypothetical protein [Pseudomonadales bacterium]